MQISSLFPTPLVIAEAGDLPDVADALRDIILEHAHASPSIAHSNLGGWQSDADFLDWAGAPGQDLRAALLALISTVTAVITPEGDLVRRELEWKINAWANINHHGHANLRHAHPGAAWSAVYYVDDGGIGGEKHLGGALELWDPRGMLPLMYAPTVKMAIRGCVIAGHAELFYPTTGALILFPAWLEHSVQPYQGNQRRMSVAFNLSV